MNRSALRIALDEEDATQLKFGREFQGAQALLISEVKVLLDANEDKRRLGEEPTVASTDIKRKTVEYCARFSRFSDKPTIKEIRQLFPPDLFHQFEAAQLANLGCESVDEAKILIPSLAKRDNLDDAQLQDLLDQMSNLRKFQSAAG
ncbi:RNA polymerase B, partial [Physocladia obscura]